MTDLKIEVTGLDKLFKAFDRFPKEIARNMSQAGHEAANDVILPTKGVQKYPSATAANKPPAPYYIRGRGTQTKSGNLGNSERLGTQWFSKREGANFTIGNRASYAKWVHGEEQARAMESIGWKKLYDVAKDKLNKIQKVYQAWVNKTIRDLDL